MKIKRLNEFSINENRRTELFGVDRKPSNVLSRQDQDFYDYYTRGKFRGLSKYELNSEIFKLAQRKDDIGVLAQFCLQIERESIAADDYIVKKLEQMSKKLDLEMGELSDIQDERNEQGIEVDDIEINNIEELKENKDLSGLHKRILDNSSLMRFIRFKNPYDYNRFIDYLTDVEFSEEDIRNMDYRNINSDFEAWLENPEKVKSWRLA